jgi:hypothetical protein
MACSKIPIIALPVPDNSFFLNLILKTPMNPLNIETTLENIAEKKKTIKIPSVTDEAEE